MSMAETLQPPPGGGPVAVAPGRRLSEARQAQNLAAADVARQLKLSVSQVEALEEGRYQQLPGPIFVRGFIRNYARLVNLDPEEVLRAAGNSLPQQVTGPETPPSFDIPFPTARPPRWPKYAVVVVVIFGALAAYEFVWNERAGVETRMVAVPPARVPLKPKNERTLPSAQPSIESRGAEAAIMTANATTTVSELPTTAAQPESVDGSRPGEKRVRLDFDQESWVEIRDRSGRVIFSQLNRPGTTREVTGLPPFSIVVGNSHGVRMTIDDRPVDLASHTKIDVARLILE